MKKNNKDERHFDALICCYYPGFHTKYKGEFRSTNELRQKYLSYKFKWEFFFKEKAKELDNISWVEDYLALKSIGAVD